ncbi:hypothetical protein [Promicromonospora sp. NPDC050880]|uniref:hypothetical protein n=1 Tax=Promicromonospora sp. NPDC050880 TaxID=3364406 RepID=UPI00379241D8
MAIQAGALIDVADFGDTGWQDDGIVWGTNWEDFQPSIANNHVEYRIKSGMVEWRGLVRRSASLSGGASNFTMFTVPTDLMPIRQKIVFCGTSITQTTGAASAGTAHTHDVVNKADMGAVVRVTLNPNGEVGISTAPGMPMAAGNWVTLSDIPPYSVD